MKIKTDKKQNKMKRSKQKVHKVTIVLILCWPSTPGHGAGTGVWLIGPVAFTEENRFSLCQPADINYRELLG